MRILLTYYFLSVCFVADGYCSCLVLHLHVVEGLIIVRIVVMFTCTVYFLAIEEINQCPVVCGSSSQEPMEVQGKRGDRPVSGQTLDCVCE